MSDEITFEWETHNLRHVLLNARGVNPSLCNELALNDPIFVPDTRGGRSASHLMIAQDNSGRFWSVAVLDKGDGVWRPITGWPSTNRQIRAYEELTE